MALIDQPVVAPDRSISGFHPIEVLQHFSKLVENKEDTEQVFHIIEATKGKASFKQAVDFIGSPEGQRFVRDEVVIPPMLDDHARWADCAPGSVAQTYVSFMESEGLSAQGLVDESHKWAPPETRPKDQVEWYFDRLRDTHDLFHVLTTYGRDALGEACLLGFSYAQNYNKGVLFVGYAGAREIKKVSGTKAPLFAAVREGQRLGKAAAKIAHQDVEALMRMDIEEARKTLNVGVPKVYRECLKIMEAEGTIASATDMAKTSAA